MLPLNIKLLKIAFSLAALSLSLSSYTASTNSSSLPKNLFHFTNSQTNTSAIKQKQNLVVADINSEKATIESVVILNLKALNEENIEAYMATIDPNSPAFELTKNAIIQSFLIYDLNYVMNTFDVATISDNTAIVTVDQTTTKIQGPRFRNNRMVLQHKFNKSQGEWKMFSSEIQKVEYLN
ncbi:hypothetical protein [Tychonema sp. BBK16]|uniref:hypothetical protein n=1 Tax=Tychonema sp. BBK16 TaxID=2699888 RepID=UPI001F15AA75|nr:hypothetical protein [Tychonema sp. BBK16]MCF6373730.1 hypothetical protein [Tychonema sp. BBK16]